MRTITTLHLEHTRQLFFGERERRESIRSSLSTPVAAISFAVFALSTLSAAVDASRWRDGITLAILALGSAAVLALFSSAYQVVKSEWLFVYHEPPRLTDIVDLGTETAEAEEERLRGVLAASYAVAYEQYLQGNAISSRCRTWALRLILASLLLQAVAFALLPFHQTGS
ncbi:hypothetical protein [Mangrovicella endophytica]|uniref:hypothetical protein n=1 Tax=Mangrovicella endophytica TaxID=2066697 RepID=UPI000C9E9ED5|nr:hypothetical protein [Mangrovicella endophytica]